MLAIELAGRRFGSARFPPNIWCLHVGLKVGFVRWICGLILVKSVSISMNAYSIDRLRTGGRPLSALNMEDTYEAQTDMSAGSKST